ncbi:MAG TPA: zinc ribbon domain-containing protein [Actinomycetota bacterium]|nr:zinc ribbon domain-containing protein [Actinomycetota bacterium]
MPTYDYKCQDCGHRFDHAQGFHEDPLEVCPDCGGRVRRVIGNVGVTFKGSGFYRTDSRASGSSGKPKSGAKPAKSDSAGDSKGSGGAAKDSGGSSKDSGSASKGSGSSAKGSGSAKS